MSEHSGLDTPGGRIRKARETRGLSVAELSERTKIPPNVLQAIERDEYHKVSGALYIKSFLRTCAGELGLDAGEVLHLYAGFAGELKPETGGADMVWEEEEVKVTRLGVPWRLMVIAGAVLILAGAGVMFSLRGCAGDRPGQATGGPAGTAAAGAGTGGNPSAAARRPEPRTGPDTLSGAWMQAAPDSAPAADREPTVTPAPTELTTAAADAADSLPLPLIGGPGLRFAGGRQRAVVLRLIFARPVDCEVRRDNDAAFVGVDWPTGSRTAPPLPATGVEEGRVYAVNRGLVVYWGADDHLSLKLAATEGVEVTVNGRSRSVRNLLPGAELLLDDHGD